MAQIPQPDNYSPQHQPDYWHQHYFQFQLNQNMRPTKIGKEWFLITTQDQKHNQKYTQIAVAKKEKTLTIQPSQGEHTHDIAQGFEFQPLQEEPYQEITIELDQLQSMLHVRQRRSTKLLVNSKEIPFCQIESLSQWRIAYFMNEVVNSAVQNMNLNKRSSFQLRIYGRDRRQMLQQSLVGMLFQSTKQIIKEKFNQNFTLEMSIEKEEHEQIRGEHNDSPYSHSDDFNTFRLICKTKPLKPFNLFKLFKPKR